MLRLVIQCIYTIYLLKKRQKATGTRRNPYVYIYNYIYIYIPAVFQWCFTHSKSSKYGGSCEFPFNLTPKKRVSSGSVVSHHFLRRRQWFLQAESVQGGPENDSTWNTPHHLPKNGLILTGAFYAGNFREWSISSLVMSWSHSPIPIHSLRLAPVSHSPPTTTVLGSHPWRGGWNRLNLQGTLAKKVHRSAVWKTSWNWSGAAYT